VSQKLVLFLDIRKDQLNSVEDGNEYLILLKTAMYENSRPLQIASKSHQYCSYQAVSRLQPACLPFQAVSWS